MPQLLKQAQVSGLRICLIRTSGFNESTISAEESKVERRVRRWKK